uniref:Uncharacterized protein n=1 Tax=Setaria viridis TaxID=4556 RepID=A0A4U6SWD0_SETVI|nr:hypothetical protein SEVIR_9G161260v2 [Setaria viridis]
MYSLRSIKTFLLRSIKIFRLENLRQDSSNAKKSKVSLITLLNRMDYRVELIMHARLQ